jgi:hypothetical protein
MDESKKLDFTNMSIGYKILLCVAVPLAGLMILLILIAMFSLVIEAWDSPVICPEVIEGGVCSHLPPPDVVAAGRLKMAEEMREWAGEEDE